MRQTIKDIEVKKTAKYYEESFKEEINKDREEHHKKPLKEKNDNDDTETKRPMTKKDF